MSTLPGQASKGEKTKQKFQSLDINSLYNKVSRGENPEKQQQKSSSSYIKHGMQSLGKVPSARRPPANLPSLKSEHSGTDAAVPLVPPGAQGWGKQDSTTSSPSTTTQQTPTSTTAISQNSSTTTVPAIQQPPSPPQLTAHQAAIALPVTNPVPHTHKQSPHSAQTAPTDKLWSSVTSGFQDGAAGGASHPPLYHSPQFQHEFPSLSSGDGVPTRTGPDALPYPTPAGGTSTGGAVGLSLRPQTEGSWSQGGQRGSSNIAAEANGGQARPGTAAHLGGPPQLPPQVGLQQQPFPPQIRGVLPPFMYKGSGFSQGPGIGVQNQNTTAPLTGPPVNGRSGPRPMESRPPRLVDREQSEELVSRPIIKEEELSRMDEISKDDGWAKSEEMDYNQTLAFSDDECEKPTKSEIVKRHQQAREQKDDRYDSHSDNQARQWNTGRSNNARGRSSEEEDIWMQRRSQTDKQVEIAVQRAKQRKEEEEKRFNEERKQGSAKKLMELEEKIQKRDKDNQEGVGTINPSTIPPKPINPVDIPLPDFQKDKDRDKENIRDREHRSRTPNETPDDRGRPQNQENSFRQLTQIEGKHFATRKHTKPNDRDQRDRDRDMREQNGPNFSRSFKEDLPPRFTKQQRSNSNMAIPNHQFERGWNQNKPQQPSGQYNPPPMHRNIRQSEDIERERDEEDRREYKRQSSEESYRSSNHSQDISQKHPEAQRYHEEHITRHVSYESQSIRKDLEEDKRQKEKEMRHQDKDSDDHSTRHASNDDWCEKKDKFRDEKHLEKNERDRERPQRPDSRDSRSTRHSRDSEPRDYKESWTESYESHYEEKRRDHHIREDRRVVPGPITKDRIEADDMRNEKRNLTQLKRGQLFDIKSEKKSDQTENKKDDTFVSAWADSLPAASIDAESQKLADEKKSSETHKTDSKVSNEPAKKTDRNDDYSRNRPYSKKSWNDYHHQRWPKRSSSRGQRSSRGSHGSDHHHATDSEGSTEESIDQKGNVKTESQKSDQKSPKPVRKFEKEEKNRDNKQEKFINEQRKYDKSDKRDSNYVPKGEPSRHGRGGGNFRNARGGISRRIDGYGPPPSKSPFGHHDDRDRERKTDEHHQSESPPVPLEDKTKQNQQALAAGIAGKRNEPIQNLDKGRTNVDNRSKAGKPRGKDEFCDTNSEHSDEKNKDNRKLDGRKPQVSRSATNRPRNAQPPRLSGDKRSYESSRIENTSRQNSNSSLKKEETKPGEALSNALIDASKSKDSEEVEDKEEKTSVNGDTEGFQEVKSKKNVKDRQKPVDEKQAKPPNKIDIPKESIKNDRDRDRKPNKGSFSAQQLTQQQIQNIPKLMETPVNPPQILPQPKTSSFPRDRQPKLPPRFAKQKMKAQFQHQMHNMGDMNDLNKPNQAIGMYTMKESNIPPQTVTACAWDKPLGPPLRNIESENMLGVTIDTVKSLDRTHPSSQGNSPNNEKIMTKPVQLQDKTLLDGTTPPVNTIIFENTNFKSTPANRNNRNEKPRSKLEESNIESSVMTGFNKPTMNELLQNKTDNKSDSMQLPLFKEDSTDMKLDFFTSDLPFTDDKKNLCISSKSIHAITSGNNTVDSLDIKIASVKKVWETSEQEGEDNQITFGGPPLDANVFSQGKDTPDDNHEGYSPSPNQTASTTTNVCKVKPTQQVSGSGQTVLNSTSHQPHSGIVAPGLMGNPLSPPPMPPVLGASVGLGPQHFTANQHIGYQASLSGSTQYGISAIPSPPTVPLVYNSTQPLQAAAPQTPVPYGAFQIDGVLSGQGRNQFSQYPSYHSLSQTASSPYSTQSVYLQTAPPHPPTAQAPPELYSSINNYRLSATAPFGQNQQLNNPTTVLISSTSNSLMSASVKPSNQPISAIGTKAGGVGQAYQQQSQQGQQVYMAYEPALQANYLTPSASVMQRGPAGPVQNNVVPTLQPSSSFYSGSTGAQTGYFQQPGSSTISSAQLQQHQAASFGLQGNVFGTTNQSHTNTGLQNFNSHFLTTPMQMAAALNAQQYRSNLPAAYIKGVNTQLSDQASRAQQLKSPSSQEVLSSVFNTGPQIPSPKSRQNPKHPPPQSSPTAQHKYNLYPGMVGQQNQNVQRYPTPIQRPVNFQQMQGNPMNQKHRNNPNSNKTPGRQYYGAQNNSLSVQNEKTEDSKINENVALSSTNSPSGTNKTATIGTSSANSVNSPSEKVKDNIKEEPTALKE